MIDKLFEKCKVSAFLYKDAAFLGTIMSKMTFKWDSSIETACASTKEIAWNPDWFMSLPERTRVSILLHELWHIARLHMVRLGNRNPQVWNMACDFRINNDLLYDGYTFEGTDGLWDKKLDDPKRLTEEEIYDILIKDAKITEKPYLSDLNYSPEDSDDELEVIQIVQSAATYAKGCGGAVHSQVEEILAQKLKPKVPWRRLLRQFFLDVSKEDYSWKRPNRRYEDIYLPSMTDGEQLTTLNYYIDTSGSISTNQLVRFNAELRNIWEDLKPKLIRVVNFDNEIEDEYEIRPDQPFNYFKFTGRGGTSLIPVRKHIEKTKPLAAIIFSDLWCEMPLSFKFIKTPIIWIIVDNPKAKVPTGKAVHISVEELNGNKR